MMKNKNLLMTESKDSKKNLPLSQMLKKKSLLDLWKKLRIMKKKKKYKINKRKRRSLKRKGPKLLNKIWSNNKRKHNKNNKHKKTVMRKEKRDFKRNLMIWKEIRVRRSKKMSLRRNL